jgi:hypothetical protein
MYEVLYMRRGSLGYGTLYVKYRSGYRGARRARRAGGGARVARGSRV